MPGREEGEQENVCVLGGSSCGCSGSFRWGRGDLVSSGGVVNLGRGERGRGGRRSRERELGGRAGLRLCSSVMGRREA